MRSDFVFPLFEMEMSRNGWAGSENTLSIHLCFFLSLLVGVS